MVGLIDETHTAVYRIFDRVATLLSLLLAGLITSNLIIFGQEVCAIRMILISIDVGCELQHL